MKFALGIILLALAVLVGPVVWQFTHYDPQAVPTSGLPWQIETLPSGESKVFDLTLGRSTLADAREPLRQRDAAGRRRRAPGNRQRRGLLREPSPSASSPAS
jgi:hypothetical protein